MGMNHRLNQTLQWKHCQSELKGIQIGQKVSQSVWAAKTEHHRLGVL